MIPEKLLDVLKNYGVVAIATQGQDGPHLVNTWHSYGSGHWLLNQVRGFWPCQVNFFRNLNYNRRWGKHEK